MSAAPLCRSLAWDSDFFGRRIARVGPGRLAPTDVDAVLAWLHEHEVDCAYWLADPDDDAGMHAAQEAGFRFVDVRMTFGRGLGDAPARPASVGPHREEDLPALARIARASHHQSRFYADPGFPAERCDDLYQTWIERSCAGWADAVLVARLEGRPAGYLSCHARPDGSGQIGLVAVAEDARGSGLGRDLVAASLDWFSRAGCTRVTVVTQGRNVGAMRLYEHAGFRSEAVGFWFHAWPARTGRNA